MTTGRSRHPLNKQAVKAADDAFYARHPGKVIKGKRQSISVTDSHAQAWRQIFQPHVFAKNFCCFHN